MELCLGFAANYTTRSKKAPHDSDDFHLVEILFENSPASVNYDKKFYDS